MFIQLKKTASKVRTLYLQNTSRRCILSCQDDQKLFSFPEDLDLTKLWLEKLGFTGVPLTRCEMNVCIKHFSNRQLTNDLREILPSAYPDKNIPGKEDEPESETDNEMPTNEEVIKVQKQSTSKTEPNPKALEQCVMITSESSKCFLKCKTYKTLHRFPPELSAYNKWMLQLGQRKKPKINRNAHLCDNHFSPTMRKGKTIIRRALPDIYLPSQCTFVNELVAPLKSSILQTVFNGNEKTGFKSVIIGGESTAPESANDNHAVPQPIFQKTDNIVCPENSANAPFECVLKCKNSKFLFRFPNVEARRQLWLSKIGLTHCFCTTRICDRHFSEKMFSNSHKRLLTTSYPDINLPGLSQTPEAEKLVKVQEIPQYICVVTVITENKKLNISNNSKYIMYTVDKLTPMRERSIQAMKHDFVDHADKAILADEEMDEEIQENIDANKSKHQNPVKKQTSSQVFPSRTKDMYECLKCGEITIDSEMKRRHLDLHRQKSNLCFYCGQKFSSGIKLLRHENQMHTKEIKHRVRRCPKEHCKKAFRSRKNLHRHLEEHSKPVKHYCPNCGRLFLAALKLNCHLLVCRPKTFRSRIKC